MWCREDVLARSNRSLNADIPIGRVDLQNRAAAVEFSFGRDRLLPIITRGFDLELWNVRADSVDSPVIDGGFDRNREALRQINRNISDGRRQEGFLEGSIGWNKRGQNRSSACLGVSTGYGKQFDTSSSSLSPNKALGRMHSQIARVSAEVGTASNISQNQISAATSDFEFTADKINSHIACIRPEQSIAKSTV